MWGRGRGAFLALLASILAGCATPQQPGPDVAPVQSSQARDRAVVHTELAAAYYSQGQYGVALQEAKEALDADSTYAPAYNARALVYMELREDGLARQNFEQALRVKPGDPETNNNYGWFLCQRGYIDDAIRHFMTAVKDPLYPTPQKAFVNAGICSLKKDDTAGAEDFFAKALKLQPDNERALYQMAALKYKAGRFAEANSYITRLMQTGAPSAESLWLGVRIARAISDKDAESSYAFQLRNKFPDSPETQALRNGQRE